jgi:hypothetical protein
MFCKKLLTLAAEKTPNCHAEVLTALGNLQQHAAGKTAGELQALNLDDFMAVCNFGAVASVPLSYHLMNLHSMTKPAGQTWRQFLSRADVTFKKHMRYMEEVIREAKSKPTAEAIKMIHEEWALAVRLTVAIQGMELEKLNKLVADIHSKGITRSNAIDKSGDINNCLTTVLDEMDRDGHRKRVALDAEPCKAEPSKKSRHDQRTTKDKQNSNKQPSDGISKPYCDECKKKSGHEFHRYVKSENGKSKVVCSKAPKSQGYVDRFKIFVSTPRGERASLPVE